MSGQEGNRGNGYDKNVTVAYPGGEIPSALARAQAMHATPATPDDIQESSTGMRIVINKDGGVDIDIKSPAVKRQRNKADFHENLADDVEQNAISSLAQDLLD